MHACIHTYIIHAYIHIQVLSVFAAIIRKAGDSITDQVPRILGAVFECTLAMITVNMEDYPEHRIKFYTLLKEINQQCFRAFFMIPGEVFKVVIDSIIWAMKHRERNIADTGLTILMEMLRNLDGRADIAQQFYAQFLLSLLHETFSVLTDKEHEPGFKQQCEILQHLVSRVEQGLPAAPLFNAVEYPGITDNRQFIRAHLLKMLSDGFSDRMTAGQLQEFVAALFDPTKDKAAFATLVRDFLVSLREYNCDQWTQSSLALQLEAQQKEVERQQAEAAKWQSVPGLMPVTKREEVDM
jgi:exportin-1